MITASIPGRSIALITYNGWDTLDSLVDNNRNEEADESIVIYAHKKRMAKNPASALGATITLYNGEIYDIDFKDIDGQRTC